MSITLFGSIYVQDHQKLGTAFLIKLERTHLSMNYSILTVTDIEKDNGILITMNTTMTVDQFNQIKSDFFTEVASSLNAYCNKADNFSSCCPNRGNR